MVGQGFDCLKNFPTGRNNGVYFRRRNILQAIKTKGEQGILVRYSG